MIRALEAAGEFSCAAPAGWGHVMTRSVDGRPTLRPPPPRRRPASDVMTYRQRRRAPPLDGPGRDKGLPRTGRRDGTGRGCGGSAVVVALRSQGRHQLRIRPVSSLRTSFLAVPVVTSISLSPAPLLERGNPTLDEKT